MIYALKNGQKLISDGDPSPSKGVSPVSTKGQTGKTRSKKGD